MADDKENMSAKTEQKTELLDKDAILRNKTRQSLFDSLMQGLKLNEAAEKANRDYKYCRNLVAKSGINDLVVQEKAIIEAEHREKLKITEEGQIKRMQELSEGAKEAGQFAASISAEREIHTLLGMYKKHNEQKNQAILVAPVIQLYRPVEVIEAEEAES